MKRAPILAVAVLASIFGFATTGVAQVKDSQRPVRRPVSAERQGSGSEVHIELTTLPEGSTSIDIGGDHWIARGYDLKSLIAQVYDMDERRIEFGENRTGDTRYDMTLTLPHDVDDNAMQQMLEEGLEQKFGLTIARRSRWMDVYVLTAPNGPGAGLHPHTASVAAADGSDATDDAEEIKFLGKKCDGVSSGGITASAGTLGEFRRTLEPDLDRLLIDETGLKGTYDFQIGKYDNEGELFKLLWEQLGIAVSPEQRSVTVLTVRPVQPTVALAGS